MQISTQMYALSSVHENKCQRSAGSSRHLSSWMITNQWLLFTNSSYYYTENNGLSLTMLENLFSDYSSQTIWKVELVALIPSRNASGSSSVMFYVNFPPRLGWCDVNPKNGSTNTLFSISCSNWVDPDGVVVSYAYYGN